MKAWLTRLLTPKRKWHDPRLTHEEKMAALQELIDENKAAMKMTIWQFVRVPVAVLLTYLVGFASYAMYQDGVFSLEAFWNNLVLAWFLLMLGCAICVQAKSGRRFYGGLIRRH